jgi:hypothetical protein
MLIRSAEVLETGQKIEIIGGEFGPNSQRCIRFISSWKSNYKVYKPSEIKLLRGKCSFLEKLK